MSREELSSKKVAELKKICKEKGIKHYNGKNCFRKDEMINAILAACSNTESVKDRDTAECKNYIHESGRKDAAANEDSKKKYVDGAKINALVAFKLPNGKVKSAKIIKKSTKNQKFMVETEYGVQYVIKYSDVIWVRYGKRWPKGVYKLLKGLVDSYGAD